MASILQRASLMTLPNEVLQRVVQHVRQRSDKVVSHNMVMHIPPAGVYTPERFYEPWSSRTPDEGLYDLLSLSQTCKILRKCCLPALWSHLDMHSMQQVVFYVHLIRRTPNATKVYGQYVRIISSAYFVWDFDGSPEDTIHMLEMLGAEDWEMKVDFASFEDSRIPLRKKSESFVPYADLENATDSLMYLFAHAPKLRLLQYGSARVPLHRTMSELLRRKCFYLEKVMIEDEDMRNPEELIDSFLEDQMDSSVVPEHVRVIDLSRSNLQGASPAEYAKVVRDDPTSPFALQITPPDELDWFSNHFQLAWMLWTCWHGAQHGLRGVELPLRADLYCQDLRMLRLWLCLEISMAPQDEYRDHCLEAKAWISAMGCVRQAIKTNSWQTCSSPDWLAAVRQTIEEKYVAFTQPRPVQTPKEILADVEIERGASLPLDPTLKETKMEELMKWILHEIWDALQGDTTTQDVVRKYHLPNAESPASPSTSPSSSVSSSPSSSQSSTSA